MVLAVLFILKGLHGDLPMQIERRAAQANG
jgi:hypothetical protein